MVHSHILFPRSLDLEVNLEKNLYLFKKENRFAAHTGDPRF
jgi:hypothetical protein